MPRQRHAPARARARALLQLRRILPLAAFRCAEKEGMHGQGAAQGGSRYKAINVPLQLQARVRVRVRAWAWVRDTLWG